MKDLLSSVFLSKRAKSFYWRAGFGVGLLFLAHLQGVLPDLQLPEFVAVICVYLINEATKALNNQKSKYE